MRGLERASDAPTTELHEKRATDFTPFPEGAMSVATHYYIGRSEGSPPLPQGASEGSASLELLHREDEAIAYIASLQTLQRLIDPADRQYLALGDDTMLVAEVQHLLCLGDPPDIRA